MTCANCSDSAVYTYKLNEATHVHYCAKHLPSFLRAFRQDDSLKLVVPSTKSSKKSAPVEEESASDGSD
jgi:hypothetical protein